MKHWIIFLTILTPVTIYLLHYTHLILIVTKIFAIACSVTLSIVILSLLVPALINLIRKQVKTIGAELPEYVTKYNGTQTEVR